MKKILKSVKWVPETCIVDTVHPIFRNAYQKSNDFLQCMYCICDLSSDFHTLADYG